METIKETVLEVMRDLANKAIDTEDQHRSLLKKTLTKKELAHIKLSYFRNGIMGLSVDSPVWLYRLSLKKEEVLERFRFFDKRIKDVRFYIGQVTESEEKDSPRDR